MYKHSSSGYRFFLLVLWRCALKCLLAYYHISREHQENIESLIICTSPCLAHTLCRCCTTADLLTCMSKAALTPSVHAHDFQTMSIHYCFCEIYVTYLDTKISVRVLWANTSQRVSSLWNLSSSCVVRHVLILHSPQVKVENIFYITHRMTHSMHLIFRHNQLPSVLLFPSQGH